MVPRPPTAALDELGRPALGQRDLDEVEVARYDSCREHLRRLVRGLGPGVPGRQVRECEQEHARLARDAIEALTEPDDPFPG